MIFSEHEEQKNLIKWWSLYSKSEGIPEELLFAIPNGGKRSVQTSRVLQSEGVRPGVPDLFLAYPCYGFSGLFIEMKRKKGGHVSEAQKEYIALLEENGYHAIVCNGFDEAREALTTYIMG